ncbi:MAG: hypothetical protein OXF02_06160 [Simkaniaceae bacterium]|nr:hypothetical protein [Simkaniaceae bacterium]
MYEIAPRSFLSGLFVLVVLFLSGCNGSDRDRHEDVVSTRYIHKYGYDVSEKEWKHAEYPGRVVTKLRDGITVTASYEEGVLHGTVTRTYPHSHTLESSIVYERGVPVRKTLYTPRGIPDREEIFYSSDHKKVTRWYGSGTPLSTEEWRGDRLVSGEYYDTCNESEAHVAQGFGVRIVRNAHEQREMRETIEEGRPVLREIYYPHGVPRAVIPLQGGVVHGEKKVFAPSGEPVAYETYRCDVLHGPATYFRNGCKYLEISYEEGRKHGTERHFVDGVTLVEETEWRDGHKHGPSVLYFDDMSRVRYYYNNLAVSKEKYRELLRQEETIATMNNRAKGVDG